MHDPAFQKCFPELCTYFSGMACRKTASAASLASLTLQNLKLGGFSGNIVSVPRASQMKYLDGNVHHSDSTICSSNSIQTHCLNESRPEFCEKLISPSSTLHGKFFKLEVLVQTQTATKGSVKALIPPLHAHIITIKHLKSKIAVQSSAIVNASNVKRPMIDVEGRMNRRRSYNEVLNRWETLRSNPPHFSSKDRIKKSSIRYEFQLRFVSGIIFSHDIDCARVPFDGSKNPVPH